MQVTTINCYNVNRSTSVGLLRHDHHTARYLAILLNLRPSNRLRTCVKSSYCDSKTIGKIW